MVSISSSKSVSPVNWSRKDYAHLVVGTSQTADLGVGNPVKFNTMVTGNMEFNPATYRVTLKANKVYRLFASISGLLSGDTGYIEVYFYNVTDSATFSNTRTFMIPPNYSSSRFANQSNTSVIVNTTKDTVIDVRIRTVSNITNIHEAYSFAEIQELDTFSPNTQKWDYAYVSQLLDLTVTGTGWTTTKAVGVFKKTNNGIWRLEFNIRGTVSSASRNTYSIVVAGIKMYSNFAVSGGAWTGTAVTPCGALCGAGAGQDGLASYHTTATTTVYWWSGEVELTEKPTHASIPSDV